MKTAFFFFLRLFFAWACGYVLFLSLWNGLFGGRGEFITLTFLFLGAGFVVVTGSSHLRRVRLTTDHVDSTALSNRHRRQYEVPLEASTAFDMLDAAVRELPGVEVITSARDSLQLRAKVPRLGSGSQPSDDWQKFQEFLGIRRNQIGITIMPNESTSSVTVVCEPENRAWLDWFLVDDATNLENANALSRAISRRVNTLRRSEAETIEETMKETATQKELAVAKLGLLHAQVEPHFLYNTLGSAKYLVKTDPDKAEAMLDNLILYLRNSLPRTEDVLATLGDELDRVHAYLEILRFRMGNRLQTHMDVADGARALPFPTMMLQTLVENAIKHGLEPKSGGGNIWLLARVQGGQQGEQLVVTVADDGLGMNTHNQGTGIGHANIRERLKLAFGDKAAFSIAANFPSGVAATITLPASRPATNATKASTATTPTEAA